jgi:hypothetical protein
MNKVSKKGDNVSGNKVKGKGLKGIRDREVRDGVRKSYLS